MGGLRSLAAPARPLRLGGIPSQSPCEGAVGERNAARFFAASAAPSRGVWGTKLCPFCSFFGKKKQSRNSEIAPEDSQDARKRLQKKASTVLGSKDGRGRSQNFSKASRKCLVWVPKYRGRNSDLARNNSHSTQSFTRKGHCHGSSKLTNDDSASNRTQFDQKRATATIHQIC